MQTDTIIIGSGISGLTAAAILAKKGVDTIVLEKQSQIGGALKQFKRKGVSFDVGFHYTGCLGENQILHTLWRYCGVLQHLNILPFPETSSDRLYSPSHKKSINAYFSYTHQKEELKKHFPEEIRAIDTYFSSIKSMCESIPFYNHTKNITDFLSSFRTSKTSLADFILSLTKNPILQSVFSYPAMLYGVPTSSVSIDIHAMVAHGYYEGAFSVKGGGQSIVDGFLTSCKAHGVRFETGRTVESIFFDGNGIKGIRTKAGTHYRCKKVIYTGHPSLLPAMIKGGLRPAYRKRLADLNNTQSMHIVFGRVHGNLSSLEWDNHIYLPPGPDPFDYIKTQDNDRLTMLTSTQKGSNCLPTQGKSVILLQPAQWQDVAIYENTRKDCRPAGYSDYKKDICHSMIQKIQHFTHSAFDIEPLAVGSPLSFRDELSAPEGCAYGVAHSIDQHTPDIRTRIPGLYLSGQSTLMTGVAGASLAGFVSAGHILGLDDLWRKIFQ